MRLMVRSGADWNIVFARCITNVSGAGIADRTRSFRVDSSIPAGRPRPIGNDSAAPQHTRLPLAPQKAAEDSADPKSQDRAEADGSHDEPPDQGQATAYGVGSPSH